LIFSSYRIKFSNDSPVVTNQLAEEETNTDVCYDVEKVKIIAMHYLKVSYNMMPL
jgi:hypothetical protein